MRNSRFLIAVPCLVSSLIMPVGLSQTPAARMPPDYRGVNTLVGGVFVTPVPNAPFSATVDIVSKETLPDGSTNIRTTVSYIARDSAGRIYNERRRLVPTTFKGDPALLSFLIYDPNTHLSTFITPYTHIAHQRVLQQRQPQVQAANMQPDLLGPHAGGQLTKEEDLGEETVGNTPLRGIRKTWTVPATLSGTGKDVAIVDEYWYSPDLSVYLIVKHEDPRTGEQIVAVKDIDRSEPEASRFAIPSGYKVVDETPVP